MATLFDKIWNAHLVAQTDNDSGLIYIDCQLLHEVTSPQAFEGLRLMHRELRHRDLHVAVPDHNVPTSHRERIEDLIAREQIETLGANCKEHGILEFSLQDIRQGIVHVIGPEQGITLPGMTIVCGDSHTSTHGAFASIAMGIGTSEVEHVMATQCLTLKKPKNMKVIGHGALQPGVYAKDFVLAFIGAIGTAGATGYAIEYMGEVIDNLSMEARMTLCNMSIEAGARCGMIAIDQTTLDYLKGRPFAPKGVLWERACSQWKTLTSDPNAHFDEEVVIHAHKLEPQVTWGTSPEMVIGVTDTVPDPKDQADLIRREHYERALKYMGLKAKMGLESIKLDRVFIGSCTNARIEDLRVVADLVKGHKKASHVKEVLVVPGSGLVKKQAEQEGLHEIFIDAGFEWREPGCSMCLGMNPDRLEPKEHCASTSNRNFEGRQGQGGRTHLCSPATAACAALAGHFTDPREAF